MLFSYQIQIALILNIIHFHVVTSVELPERCTNGYNFSTLECGNDLKEYDLFGNEFKDFEFKLNSNSSFNNKFVEVLDYTKNGAIKAYEEIEDTNILFKQGIVDSVETNKESKSNFDVLKYAAGITNPEEEEDEYFTKEQIEELLDFTVSLKSSDNKMYKLEMYMAKYHLNGTLVGFNFTSDELLFCSRKKEDKTNFLKFGNNIKLSCHIDLMKFLDFRKQMYFYRFFIFDTITDKPNPIAKRIPILIQNIQHDNTEESELEFSDGTKIKHKLNKDLYVDKMFLFDNLSGFKTENDNKLVFSSKDSKDKFKYLTYAKKIQFEVELNKDEKKIYRPVIKVFYSTRKYEDIMNFPSAHVEFISEYKQDISSFMRTALGLLIAIIVVVIALVIYRMYVWTKLNPRALIQEHYVLSFICTMFFKLCKFFGLIMFFYLYLLTCYWSIFYKGQYKLYLLLPPLSQYEEYYMKFDIAFGISFGLYIIYMCYRLYCQLNFDIFFIDWEPEKEIFINNLSVQEHNTIESRNTYYRGAWRLLHVANQFHALECRRNISFYFGYCFLLTFYYFHKADWRFGEQHVPITEYIEYSENNYILRHCITTSVIGIVGACMFLFRFLVHCWLPYKETEFVDLCSVANISVFILNEKLHGYYVHGKSIYGKADLNLWQLYQNLDSEGQNLQKERGISNEDQQDFEMYISVQMREIYEGLFLIQNETLFGQNQKKDEKAAINQRQLRQLHLHFDAKGMSINVLRNYMNNQLKDQIEMVEASKSITEQTCIQKIMDYPPDNIEVMDVNRKNEKQRILLLKGTSRNFSDVLFSGMEFEWFIMDLYWFQMWMIALKDVEIAMLLTFICDQILYLVRVFIGEKNLSKKAVIDNRFIS